MASLARLIFLLCLSTCMSGNAQEPDPDSKGIESRQHVNKIDRMISDAQALAMERKWAAAEILLQSAAREASDKGYAQGIGAAFIGLSNIAYAKRDFEASEKYGQKALQVFGANEAPLWLAHARRAWGTAVWAQSRFDEAISAFQAANDTYRLLSDSSGLGATNALLALAEEERGNYVKSFQYAIDALGYKHPGGLIAIGQLYADVGDYDAALSYYSQISDDEQRVSNYLKVGEVHLRKKNYDSALYFYQEYLRQVPDGDFKGKSKPFVLLGELYVALKRYDSALFYLDNALKGFRDANDRNWIMRSLLELSKAHRERREDRTALAYSRELLTYANRAGALQYSRDAHFILYELFNRLHQSDSAFAHLSAFTSLNKQIDIETSARNLAFYKSSTQLQQARLQIALLDRQKQLQEEEIKQATIQRWALVVAVFALMIIFGVLARNFYLKRRNAEHLRQLSENELQIEKLEHSKKLAELEMQILRVQMNPHFIFNSLNSINRFILTNANSDATQYLTKLSRLVRMILQNSQNSLISLEDELDCLKLYLELEGLRFDHQFKYHVTIDSNVDQTMIKVPPLIIQPFVENAIWHGLMPKHGGQIDIDISADDEFLRLRIADDGIGRAASAASRQSETSTHRSLGLSITSQRIRMANNGTADDSLTIIDLADAAGKPAGTEVNIKLPLA